MGNGNAEPVRITYTEGPLDGWEVTYEPGEIKAPEGEWGAYMVVHGSEMRAVYEPDPEPADQTVWRFRGWIP